MRLVYLAPADIQIARVDRQCIVRFCSALARTGVDVELVALRIRPMRGEPRVGDPLDLYGVRDRFPTRLRRVPVGQRSPGPWLALNRAYIHAREAMRIAREGERPRGEPLVFYTKTFSTAAMLLGLRPRLRTPYLVVFEAHVPPRNAMQRGVLRAADRVVANTFALERDLLAAGHVTADRVVGTHQGVDEALVAGPRPAPDAARARLGLPRAGRLVVYTGKIFEGYPEVEHLLAAARELRDREGVSFLLVGGRADHVARLRERVAAEGLRNVTLAGFVPPREVRDYQLAADALVLYYPSGIELNEYRSPGKLFEYMASGRPIVAVDLPVLREVLGDPPAAVLVRPDAPAELARAIAGLLDDEPLGARLAEAALQRVAAFTWEERARTIAAFVRGGPPGDAPAAATPERRGGTPAAV